MFCPHDTTETKEYSDAATMMDEMNHLRRVWANFKPAPPLKRSDIMLLGTIHRLCNTQSQPVTVSRLAQMMQQSPPGISQKVSFLEHLGYVTRTADEADRRVVYISITPKGIQVAQSGLQHFLSNIQKALDILGTQKTTQLLQLINELRQAIEHMSKESDER